MAKPKPRVLICEDDVSITEVIKIVLESRGYSTKIIYDGTKIISEIEKFAPHVMLLDIWLPGIDGRDIIKLLRQKSNFPFIPIIVMTALNDIEAIAEHSKADGYLAKPFTSKELLGIVEKHIGEQQSLKFRS